MSKAALKKELQKLDQEQLVQVILDAYEGRAETKEYFEFFLNPDIDKLMGKFEARIGKELNRTKWGTSKARVTVLKRAVKDFIGLNPGVDAVMDMLFTTVRYIGILERHVNLTDAQERFAGSVLAQIVDLADKHQIVAETMPRIEKLLDEELFSRYYRKMLGQSLESIQNGR